MKVLVACEESQRVCIEFRKLGHEAYSCDIESCNGGHPEWHIQDDVLPLLNGNCDFKTVNGDMYHLIGKWDMIIAFPPCTHLAVSGARYFEEKRLDSRQIEGLEFFCKFFEADCNKIVIENPVNIISGDYVTKWFPDIADKYDLPRKPTQRIHPWMFGDNFSKCTCLWEKGVDPLVPIIKEEPEMEYHEWVDKKTGKKKRENLWMYKAFINTKTTEDRRRVRSKTFPGIAKAMAEQWGKELSE